MALHSTPYNISCFWFRSCSGGVPNQITIAMKQAAGELKQSAGNAKNFLFNIVESVEIRNGYRKGMVTRKSAVYMDGQLTRKGRELLIQAKFMQSRDP